MTGTLDVLLPHDVAHQFDVLRRADERQRHVVHRQVQREAQVVDVLVRQRRHADRHPGQRQPLVVGDLAALDDQAEDVGALDVDHREGELAVVDQQPVTDADVVGQALVGVETRSAVPCDVVDGDADPAAGLPDTGPVGERAEPDLGALQVGQDGDRAAGAVGGLPDQP